MGGASASLKDIVKELPPTGKLALAVCQGAPTHVATYSTEVALEEVMVKSIMVVVVKYQRPARHVGLGDERDEARVVFLL